MFSDTDNAQSVSLDLQGEKISGASGRILTSASINDHNTFEKPEQVKPTVFNGAKVEKGQLIMYIFADNNLTQMKLLQKTLLACLLTGQFVHAQTEFHIYDTIQVTHHNLYFDIRNFKDQTLYGKADISIQSKMDDLEYVPLLLLQMDVDSIWVDGSLLPDYQYNDTLLRIPLASPLNQGDQSQITIAYHGKPIAARFGGFVFNDSLQMAYNMGVSINDIPHSYGRGWFPAVDDFRSRSTFDFRFRIESSLKAIGNGLLKDTVSNGDGTTTWHWTVNQPIPEYLVNVAVGNYRKIGMSHQQTDRTLPIDIYVLPQEIEKAREAYAIVPQVLESMEKRFGEYSFDRVGYVSVASTGGAMEHVGNISMPMNPQPTLDYQLYIIHELIHGWFGNKVTCATAGDMWLNEGITTFCQELVLQDLFSQKEAKNDSDNNLLSILSNTLRYDGGYYPLQGMPQEQTYGITTYNKGAAVMHTLRYYLGDDLLIPALKDYIDTFAFHHVTTDEFKNFLSTHTGKNLNDFFNLWIKQPGLPAFEIDSIVSTLVNNSYKETIYLEQKLCHANEYGHNVRVPITLFDETGTKSEEIEVTATGEKPSFMTQTPFKPAYWVINRNNDVAMASFTRQLSINQPGQYSLPGYNLELECKQTEAPANVYLQHYWVAPDAMQTKSDILISDSHYWRIAGHIPASCLLGGKFSIDKKYLDNKLLKDYQKEMLIMYRPTPSENWQELSSGSLNQGYFIVADNLKAGEYCLAVRVLKRN